MRRTGRPCRPLRTWLYEPRRTAPKLRHRPESPNPLAKLEGLEVERIWVWWSLRFVFDLGAGDEPDAYVDVTEFDWTVFR